MVVVVGAVAVLASAPDAGAIMQPNGTGGCNTPNLTCYPECRWEWTGQSSLTTPDAAPCPWLNEVVTTSVQSSVNVGNLPATQTVAGTVDVGNLPATQTVAGTVNVGNEPTVHCVTGANIECRSTVVEGSESTEDNPFFVKTAGDGGAAFEQLHTEVLFASAVGLFLACSAWWMDAGRRRRA